ncbi:universal stress protein [Aeromicrobium chenweiae]|uniref:Universal stress protein n=1 Tax=Aeromicrobium chenweiae TaxID=2079793 RepID=A0A2S0WQL5_9ACTN|nr:universal stress protein [Aeromicrobium chenweiae]AWB93626.1 universal stress protein [Aeromicrobium chenweiae]TGN33275.1 universal stress protein [Aeromicrobium chenweiae]
MHVIIATDGSQQSVRAARYLRSFADPDAITSIGVIAVLSPLAAVPFAGEATKGYDDAEMSFRDAAKQATKDAAAILEGWGPRITTHVRSGNAATEIVRAAKAKDAGLIVIASQSSRAEAVLMGSVAHKVLNNATCPVLVVRPGAKTKKPAKAAKHK